MNTSVICRQCNTEFSKRESEIKRMEKRGYKNHFCSLRCCCLYNKNINVNILPDIRRSEYYQNPKKCLNCNSTIPYEKKNNNLNYCSHKCGALHMQKDKGLCKWNAKEKERLRELAKKNPYFNGTFSKKIEKIEKVCPTCNNIFFTYPKSKQLCCSKKCSVKWIVKTGYLKGKSGGYREKGGRGKQGWYKGYYCNSSWELAWVIYQLDRGLQFKRNTQGFEYEFENRKYKFYPDFIIENGNYVEIKAYIDAKNKEKILNFPHKLQVIGRNDIKLYIQYVEETYGKDYIRLYETH
jgi:hypothetical protein